MPTPCDPGRTLHARPVDTKKAAGIRDALRPSGQTLVLPASRRTTPWVNTTFAIGDLDLEQHHAASPSGKVAHEFPRLVRADAKVAQAWGVVKLNFGRET